MTTTPNPLTKPPPPTTPCWLWPGTLTHAGYGTLVIAGKRTLAHRMTYELANGLIPSHLEIDHLCFTRSCINPTHLEAVTHKENQRRSRTTHCPNGHLRTKANTYLRKDGGQRCRTCRQQ